MRRRVFICGYYNFPRGSASANYVQYLSQAFLELNYDVIIVSNINKCELNKNENFVKKNQGHIILESIELQNGKIAHYLDYHFRLGKYVTKNIKKYNLGKNDLIITYSSNLFVNLSVINLKKRYGCKIGACIVEWFSAYDFNKLYLDFEFWKYYYTFHDLFPKYDFLLPISTYIEHFFKKKGCKTLCLPIMADAYEFSYKIKTPENKKKFIYPANGKMKDSLLDVIRAIELLDDHEIGQMEFHLCGVKKEIVYNLIADSSRSKIQRTIIIHSWMEYDELVSLYQDMDYLILAREINQMTKANFPSKVPEAMCYGIIPVVSKVGDYTEYYLKDGNNSIIMNESTPETIANAIKRCLSMRYDDFIKLRDNARYCAETRFNYTNWTDKIEYFINQ